MTIRDHLFLGVLLATSIIACVAAYWIGIDGPFLLDDSSNINQAVITESSYKSWMQAAFSNDSGRLGRPVAAASFAFTSLFHGLDPAAFKYHNLMIHLLVGILLWPLGAILLRHMPSPQPEARAWYISGAAATLWLLHPLLVSTTLYAVQRMTQLAILFLIIALLAYVFFRIRLHQRPLKYGTGMAGTVAIAGLIGIFSKENAALLPCYLLMIEIIVFRWRPTGTGNAHISPANSTASPNWRVGRRVLLTFHVLFVLLPLNVAVAYVILKWPDFMHGYNNRNFTLEERLLTESHVLWFYIKGILLPRAAELSLLHDAYPVQPTIDIRTAAALVGHTALIGAATALIRRAPVLSLGVAIFYISHLLESSFIPLELVFEHRNYFAAWGLLFALTYYLYLGIDSFNRAQWAKLLALTGLAATFAVTTHTRALTWQSAEHINLSALELYPDSVRSLSNLANISLRYREIDRARAYLMRAIENSPNEAGPAIHLLFTYCKSETYPDELYESIRLRLRTGYVTAYTESSVYSLGALARQGECPALSTKEATTLLTAFLENPRIKEKSRYYTMIEIGRAHLADGRTEIARSTFMDADRLRNNVQHLHRLFALEGIVFSSLAGDDIESAQNAVEKINALLKDPRFKSVFDTKSMLDSINEVEPKMLNMGDRRNEILVDDNPLTH
ncbi:hypothetical protein [Thiohalobacter thiocyanaticus]|uniref:hypothetical protein n=1 Tax=Thiohalobacter thiocyanaticus TaxID=585455 RepID=UPI000F637B1E|nr:hypothetical protein [Thiohalobacter thiocyanaticus]